ncbi:hypothetical protein SAMN05444162_4986 [Paenibacillaceae bacterium GAS479]|nr:hypothetical protein SAMN05444162_4986 [Paenibacillaceae bacterium GAS479]
MLTIHAYPEAYIRFLAEFHGTRDYFECHELLEEYWKEHPDDADAGLWHGLIQIAVGQYHLRRGNREGARKMLRSAWQRLSAANLDRAGLDGIALLQQLDEAAGRLEAGESLPYESWTLPILDPELLAAAQEQCRLIGGATWCDPSVRDESLVHRHRVRDRSDVILARQESLEKRRGGASQLPKDPQ